MRTKGALRPYGRAKSSAHNNKGRLSPCLPVRIRWVLWLEWILEGADDLRDGLGVGASSIIILRLHHDPDHRFGT